MKQGTTPRRVRRKARILIFIYGFLSFFTVSMILVPASASGVDAVFLVLSALLIWKVIKWFRAIRMANQFPQYVHALHMSGSSTVQDLSARLKQPVKHVVRNMKTMARLGLLPEVAFSQDGAFTTLGSPNQSFDQLRAELLQRELEQKQQEEAARAREAAERSRAPQAVKFASVRCESCGAKNRVARGDSVDCPYCGALVKAKGEG